MGAFGCGVDQRYWQAIAPLVGAKAGFDNLWQWEEADCGDGSWGGHMLWLVFLLVREEANMWQQMFMGKKSMIESFCFDTN